MFAIGQAMHKLNVLDQLPKSNDYNTPSPNSHNPSFTHLGPTSHSTGKFVKRKGYTLEQFLEHLDPEDQKVKRAIEGLIKVSSILCCVLLEL